jgi:fibronectin type 3 domain-containing protein
MKTTLSIGSIILMITGCTPNNPIKSSPNIPQVGYVHSLSDRNAIALEWSIVNRPNIAGYYIQKSEDKKHYTTIKKITNRYQTHWTDTNVKQNHTYFYKISTYNKKGIPSYAKFIQAHTLGPIEPVPFIANANLKAKGMIKIIFRPNPNERITKYKIQRFNDQNAKWETIDILTPRLSAEYIDKGLVDGKIYQYRIISVSFDGLESLPSKVLTAKTLQKPAIIIQAIATNNLPKQIHLSWNKVKSAVKYNIYESPFSEIGFTLKTTTKNNFYDDLINKDGVTRYYKITSVDKYGIESMMPENPIMGSTLSIPEKPIVSIVRENNSVKFILTSPDGRAVKYLIKKDDGDKILKIHNVYNGWTDTNIKPKKSYTYKIYAIDKNGLVSNPNKVEVTF